MIKLFLLTIINIYITLGQACKCGAKNCRGVIGGKGKDFADKNKMTATNSPMTISTQLASDAKYYSTKVKSMIRRKLSKGN